MQSVTIEFAGLPNTGKTTLIKGLSKELPKAGISVTVLRESAEVVPVAIPKKTWDRNMWTTFHSLQDLVLAKHAGTDVVLIDRSYYDAVFWAEFMKKNNLCSSSEYDAMSSILRSCDNLCLKPDFIFLLNCSIEVSLKRRLAQAGLPAPIYSTDEFLSAYQQELLRFFEGFEKSMSYFYLDTTFLSEDMVVQMAKARILELFESK